MYRIGMYPRLPVPVLEVSQSLVLGCDRPVGCRVVALGQNPVFLKLDSGVHEDLGRFEQQDVAGEFTILGECSAGIFFPSGA